MKIFMKFFICSVMLFLCLAMLVACDGDLNPNDATDTMDREEGQRAPNTSSDEEDSNLNEFNEIAENEFVDVVDDATSTFSLNVNTAGYPLLRSTINNTNTIDKNQVKIEEIVNYFDYDYPEPEEGDPLSLNANLFDCPWSSSKLLTVGLKAEDLDVSDVRNNLVLLIDVSGSMGSPDKLDLAKRAFTMMLDNFDENDVISIVTYSGEEKVVLSGANGGQNAEISEEIEDLTAAGVTAGERAMQTAYSLAEDYYIEDGNNRIVLATDGDFNVGISSQSELETFISGKRDNGIYLTALGFGYGNLKDNKLETLANCGNGNYGYIDSMDEARRILVHKIRGTMHTVARDAKANVVFNPAKVKDYRLIGYENLALTDEEWEDESTDAGEIGSGFCVTAVYEVNLEDSDETSTMDDNLLEVQLRYKSPDMEDDTQEELSVYADESNITDQPNEDMLFISAVVETCLILRESEYKGEASIDNVLTRLNSLDSVNDDEYRAEFKGLVEKLIENYYS